MMPPENARAFIDDELIAFNDDDLVPASRETLRTAAVRTADTGTGTKRFRTAKKTIGTSVGGKKKMHFYFVLPIQVYCTPDVFNT